MSKQKINMINILMSLILVLINVNNIYNQTSAQISIPFEVYDNAGGEKTLYFGLDQSATDGIDVHLGESDLPPFPPIGAFDARWLLPQNGFNGSLSSWSDYRFASSFPFSGTIEYRFRYQSTTGATAMFVGWNLPSTITGLIQDLSGGAIINVPISGSGTYQITDYQTIDKLKLFVDYNDIVSVVEDEQEFPSEYILEQNYPNPFNPSTTISFALPEASNVKLIIYNTLGQKIDELVNSNLEAGWYNYQWNPGTLATGIYIYELRTDKFISVKKMLFLK